MTLTDRESDAPPAIAVPIVDSPPGEQPVGWPHRHLLDVDTVTWPEIELVMRTTDAMKEVLDRPISKVPALRGVNVTTLFYEASTRTRVSFEVAAKNLSADVVNIAAATSSVAKGESLVDTVRTVEALGAQILVMRHSVSGAPYLAAETFGGSVVNGGDGWHAHPTQALLDLYTMRAHLDGGSLEGRKVVILGDVLHSRVARSNIWTLTAAGADVWLCGPATLLRGFEAWGLRGAADGRRFNVTSSVDEALRDADVVMALRIQRSECKTHHTVFVFSIHKILLSIRVGSNPNLFPFMGAVVDKIQTFTLADSRLPVFKNSATSGYLLDNTVPCI